MWSHFPQDQVPTPGPKPRPALMVKVFDDRAPHGQTPKLGVLHPSLMRRVQAAWGAVHE